MSTLDMTDEVPSETVETEEPNITTIVEDVEDEESVQDEPAPEEVAASETAEPANEVVEPEPVVEPAQEEVASETLEEVKSSDNDLENRVKELEERLEIILQIMSYDSNLKKHMNSLL